MDKIDILIQRIEEEITSNKDMLTELALTSKDQEFRKIIKANIRYLEIFKKMAVEVKEEE